MTTKPDKKIGEEVQERLNNKHSGELTSVSMNEIAQIPGDMSTMQNGQGELKDFASRIENHLSFMQGHYGKILEKSPKWSASNFTGHRLTSDCFACLKKSRN